MVHDFKNKFKNNGNIHVEFLQNDKKRRIIFENGSQSLIDYIDVCEEWVEKESNSQNNFLSITDEVIIGFINELRVKYHFTVNPNNPSIFTPVKKVSIDNQIAKALAS